MKFFGRVGNVEDDRIDGTQEQGSLISPIQPAKDAKNEGNAPVTTPARTRNIDPSARPSKFRERLSIATASWSEIGRLHKSQPEQNQAPGRTAPTRVELARAADITSAKDAMKSAPSPQPIPVRTTSTRIHSSKTAPKRATTFEEKSTAVREPRPGLTRRRTTAQTQYMDMLLGLDSIPRLHNILAAFSTWVLLAGYLVFPATFSSLQQDQKLDQQFNSGVEQKILHHVKNLPLLYVAAFACGIGVSGCLWLWLQHRKNYVWVINRIFLPVFMNSIAGLISTLINVYSAQEGQYSITAKVTVIVTGACTVVGAGLFLLYNNLVLDRIKKKHRRDTEGYQREIEGLGMPEIEREEKRGRPARRGGFLSRMLSRANKPGVEPESVV